MLKPEAIKEFKQLYKKHFGTDLDDREAFNLANNFLNLYKSVYGNYLRNHTNRNINDKK